MNSANAVLVTLLACIVGLAAAGGLWAYLDKHHAQSAGASDSVLQNAPAAPEARVEGAPAEPRHEVVVTDTVRPGRDAVVRRVGELAQALVAGSDGSLHLSVPDGRAAAAWDAYMSGAKAGMAARRLEYEENFQPVPQIPDLTDVALYRVTYENNWRRLAYIIAGGEGDRWASEAGDAGHVVGRLIVEEYVQGYGSVKRIVDAESGG